MALPTPRSRLKPRKSPSQERSSFTVDAIVQATAHILVEHGYAELSTTRVAERAGVSIGSLYQYFPNREALVSELIRRRSLNLIEAILAVPVSPGDTLRSTVEVMMQAFLARKRTDFAVSMALVPALPELQGRATIIETARDMAEAIAERLRVVLGRPWVPEDSERLNLAIAAIEGTIWEAVTINPASLKTAEFGSVLADVFLAIFARPLMSLRPSHT